MDSQEAVVPLFAFVIYSAVIGLIFVGVGYLVGFESPALLALFGPIVMSILLISALEEEPAPPPNG